MLRPIFAVLLLGLLAGCPDDKSTPDTGIEPDGGSEAGADASGDADAGDPDDAGDEDAGKADADVDAGDPDAGEPDAGEEDAGDSGATDTCENLTLDGDETDVDCGGSCGGCDFGESCDSDADCSSDNCGADDTCGEPAHCEDDTMSGDETDVDCGGSCGPCADGEGCMVNTDCMSEVCQADSTCHSGPLARFTLSRDGASGLTVTATDHSTSALPITQVRYDWGEGDGFEASAEHVYAAPGSYAVRMRVRDEDGGINVARLMVRVRDFDARLDRATAAENVWVERDDLTVAGLDGIGGVTVGVLGDTYIEPGSGAYYFEATWLGETWDVGESDFGIAVVEQGVAPGDPMSQADTSLYITPKGHVMYNGALNVERDPEERTFGIVVDYRGTNPVVHVIKTDEDPDPWYGRVATHTMDGATGPVTFAVGGRRTALGPAVRLNTGRDTQNFPFRWDPNSVLETAIAGLVLGFDGTGSFAADDAPVVTGPDSASVPFGDSIQLSVTVTDEDGDIGHSVVWENLSETFNDRAQYYGDTITFTPPTHGRHYMRARVYDREGQLGEHVIEVTATGALPHFDTVEMIQEPTTGVGVEISPDGLQVRFTNSQKSAVRGNQGVMGGFHYFEAHRVGDPPQQGVGLVTAFGNLDPYATETTPYSCSAQIAGGIWRNLVLVDEWENRQPDVGVAVDYRGDYPIVYFIANDTVQSELHLIDISVPVHPMLYGRPFGAGYQWLMNFGDDSNVPMANDPVAALTAHGVDPAELVQSWGR